VTAAIPTGARLTFGGVVRSEWIKLVTLRSTVWCYVIIAVLTIGLGLLVAGLSGVSMSEEGVRPVDIDLPPEIVQSTWLQTATIGINFAQLVIAVLGALVITGEYGTGMIRSTFAAVPGRLAALVGKVLVFGVVSFVVAFVSLVVTAVVTIPLLAANGFDVDIADPAIWLGLVGSAGFVALIGVMSLGLGAIIRNSAGAIAAALGLLLVLPTVLQVFGALTQLEWVFNATAFLPSSAGSRLSSYPTPAVEMPAGAFQPLVLDAGQSLLVLLVWVAVPLVVGAVLLKRRDT
jgi:ABC-2 type transport system permease protein